LVRCARFEVAVSRFLTSIPLWLTSKEATVHYVGDVLSSSCDASSPHSLAIRLPLTEMNDPNVVHNGFLIHNLMEKIKRPTLASHAGGRDPSKKNHLRRRFSGENTILIEGYDPPCQVSHSHFISNSIVRLRTRDHCAVGRK
jgi:hypothetical protein